jgi:uncharacterized protein with HEPN domain
MPPDELSPRDRDLAAMRDMLHCIELIDRHTCGLRGETVGSVPELRDAVLYRFIVLGEAAGRVSEETRQRHPEVDWVRANKMRNFLVHVYDQIKWEIVWGTVTTDLPPMEAALRAALGLPPKPASPDGWSSGEDRR